MVLDLSPQTVQRVRAIAESQHTTEDRVVVDLIESGLESRRYTELVEKLASSTDPRERNNLKEELARLTFGE